MSDPLVGTAQKKLFVILPARNEASSVREVVTRIIALRNKLPGHELRVYVIDDGSTDETGRLALEAGADRVLRHSANQGLGSAVRTGLAAAYSAGADIVVKLDADLQHDPEEIPLLIEPITADTADVVYGNRLGHIDYRMPFVRRAGNAAFSGLMRKLTRWPVRDSQPGFFAVNRCYLERHKLPGDYNYTQQILLDAYLKGMRFAHVPVTFHRRKGGASFVSFKYPLVVLLQLLMVLAGIKPLRVFAPVGMFFLMIAGSLFAWEITLWFRGITPRPVIHVFAVLGCAMFGLQAFFFGILAQLIVQTERR